MRLATAGPTLGSCRSQRGFATLTRQGSPDPRHTRTRHLSRLEAKSQGTANGLQGAQKRWAPPEIPRGTDPHTAEVGPEAWAPQLPDAGPESRKPRIPPPALPR